MTPSSTPSIPDLVRRADTGPIAVIDRLKEPKPNPFTAVDAGLRPRAAIVEDAAFGDSGKGAIIDDLNTELKRQNPHQVLRSYRFNGSANAGHEIAVAGVKLALHQLPVAVVQDGAVAIMGGGMLIHPADLAAEIRYVEARLGAALPATLKIDPMALLGTDLHRAFENVKREDFGVGKGSTNTGVSAGYAQLYERRVLRLEDLAADSWEEAIRRDYRYYARMIGQDRLAATQVSNLRPEDGKRVVFAVGDEDAYVERMGAARAAMALFIDPGLPDVLESAWRDPAIPFTFEGAQGPGLDIIHGVYPDVTSSRTLARAGVLDSTQGIVEPLDVPVRAAVVKVPYMSSVGSRVHPYAMSADQADRYRQENDEWGRSTGRPRGIYPIDLVAMRHYARIARNTHVAFTHFDSARADRPIGLVTAYRDRRTGADAGYRPSQRHWDRVTGVIETVAGWDGRAAASARGPAEIPVEGLRFAALIRDVLGLEPLMAKIGPARGEGVWWFVR